MISNPSLSICATWNWSAVCITVLVFEWSGGCQHYSFTKLFKSSVFCILGWRSSKTTAYRVSKNQGDDPAKSKVDTPFLSATQAKPGHFRCVTAAGTYRHRSSTGHARKPPLNPPVTVTVFFPFPLSCTPSPRHDSNVASRSLLLASRISSQCTSPRS